MSINRLQAQDYRDLAVRNSTAIVVSMPFGVFIHRTDSIYGDVPSERYQFPKQYLSRAKRCDGDRIVYLEPRTALNTRGCFAASTVQEIVSDLHHHDMFIAIFEPGTYLDFGVPVSLLEEGSVVERGVLNYNGRVSGRAQDAV